MATADTEQICESCLWTHDPLRLANTPPCDPTTWAGSVQHALLEHGTAPDFSIDPGPFRAFPRVAAVMMIKDEADIIHANLSWLFRMGIRRFLVMDNMSTDGTWDELMRFRTEYPEATLLAAPDRVVAYFQSEKTTAMAQVALAQWPDLDWILPVDADEFCIARHGMHALAYVPPHVDALTIPKLVHFLRRGAPEDEPPLPHMTVRSSLYATPPKVVLRARKGVTIDQGNHKILDDLGKRIVYAGGFQYGFFHREFQTRGFAHFLRKVRNGGVALVAAKFEGRDVGGEHWFTLYKLLLEEGERGLRRAFEAQCLREPDAHFVLDAFW